MANPPTPLPPILAFTFLNSLGTGVVTNGVFFLFRHAYGFSDNANYLVGIVYGAVYIATCFAVGPVVRRALARFSWLSPRAVLAATMLALCACCFLPLIGERFSPGTTWAAWTLAVSYAVLTGVLWPITESYQSGGRTGRALRTAIGRFNVTWASALVVAFWGMAPLLEDRPLAVIAALGVVHLGAALHLTAFGREPGTHLADPHEPHPPVYRDLLGTFRLLLPVSYILLSAISPYLPGAFERMGVAVAWQTPLAAMWMVTRLASFALLGQWHGWHGRWSLVYVSGALMTLGFILIIIADAPVLAATGLGVLGLGIGVAYSAALYYAMEVGSASVDAGGKHEALIGIGYTAGPGVMLAASLTVGGSEQPAFAPVVFTVLGAIGLAVAAVAVRNRLRVRSVVEPCGDLRRTRTRAAQARKRRL